MEAPALRSLAIITAGICGEAGEASEHFKKWMRDGRLNKIEAGIELGDTLAYLTWLAKTLGYTLEDIAKLNYDKLTARGAPTPR
jgi:NTP pyrophosphatase (non-canonical NTP hydrolase)